MPHAPSSHQKKVNFLLFLIATGVVSMLLQSPIPQDTDYHGFADARHLFILPNFWNVVSNLPFVFIGAYAVYHLSAHPPASLLPGTRGGYLVFFFGIIFTGLGSAYYHLDPNNHTLLWDRLPMTMAFMGFFAVMVAEFISLRAGKRLLWPLVFLGAASVLYWYLTEVNSQGDLRGYVLVQFMPILLTPFILLLFKPPFTSARYLWLVILAYLIAKVFETYDDEILRLTNEAISGHSLKHVAAALAPLLLLRGIYQRQQVSIKSKNAIRI